MVSESIFLNLVLSTLVMSAANYERLLVE